MGWGRRGGGKWVCIGQLILCRPKKGVDGCGDLACRKEGRGIRYVTPASPTVQCLYD